MSAAPPLTKKNHRVGVPTVAQLGTQYSLSEHVGLIPGLTQWVRALVCYKLWCRLAAAASNQPLAQELPYAAGAAIKKNKKQKTKKNKQTNKKHRVNVASL